MTECGMVEHGCRMMSFEIQETNAVPSADSDHLVRYDERQNSYALVIPNDPAGRAMPISYCPWCATKLRRVRARGLAVMTPDTCRAARKAVSMTQRQLAEAIGESLSTLFRYEMGKPTDQAVAEKLLRFFEECQIAVDRSGRIGRYQP